MWSTSVAGSLQRIPLSIHVQVWPSRLRMRGLMVDCQPFGRGEVLAEWGPYGTMPPVLLGGVVGWRGEGGSVR